MKAAVIHIRINPDLKRQAEIAAQAEGTTSSEIVRRALTHYLEKNKC
jgi:predicted transcriptional regulator